VYNESIAEEARYIRPFLSKPAKDILDSQLTLFGQVLSCLQGSDVLNALIREVKTKIGREEPFDGDESFVVAMAVFSLIAGTEGNIGDD
jgi:hypothetical protein